MLLKGPNKNCNFPYHEKGFVSSVVLLFLFFFFSTNDPSGYILSKEYNSLEASYGLRIIESYIYIYIYIYICYQFTPLFLNSIFKSNMFKIKVGQLKKVITNHLLINVSLYLQLVPNHYFMSLTMFLFSSDNNCNYMEYIDQSFEDWQYIGRRRRRLIKSLLYLPGMLALIAIRPML